MENINTRTFQWPDYLVFVISLLICIGIGIYFGFVQVSKNTTDYLLGGRKMKPLPVAISIVVSFVSGIAFVGTPAEIYVYGMQYSYIIFGTLTIGLVAHFIFLPVFLELKLTSIYEYLENRFDRSTRRLGSLLYIVTTLFWLPIVVYVPALALNQVTTVDLHYISALVTAVCVFYTCVGGIKAVVWTDFIQTFFMIGAIILVIIKGTIEVGGFSTVLELNINTTRFEPPNWSWDPLIRHTFWASWIGGGVFMLQSSVTQQPMIQRYQTLPNWKAAVKTLWYSTFGLIIVVVLFSFTGMLIYARYADCDPLQHKDVHVKDQLLPFLVMDVLENIPGFAGMFLAGIFSASLSSLSGSLNSFSAVILEDFYKPLLGRELSSLHADVLMKSVVVVIGLITFGLSIVVEKLGGVLQLAISLQSIAMGPSLALFTLGVLCPWIDGKGAFFGGVLGLGFMSWVCLGTQAAIGSHQLVFPTKPTSIDGCGLNATFIVSNIEHNSDDVFILYRISYLWYTLLGCLITIIVAFGVNLITGFNNRKNVPKSLIAPFLREKDQEKDINL